MSKIEILAPVGSEEMLRAAVFSGADAVYLGFSGFNARTGAGNFDADSLKEAVRFCHARGVKVHVTLNTLVYDRELSGLADAVRAVAAAGADVQPQLRLLMLAEALAAPPTHRALDLSAETAVLCTAASEAVRRRPGWLQRQESVWRREAQRGAD